MSHIITAVVENGMLKPDEPLNLPPQTSVRLLIVGPVPPLSDAEEKSWQELEQLWDEASVDSGGVHLTRDQLHERR